MRLAVTAILNRPQALRVRAMDHRVIAHPQFDTGCASGAAAILRPYAGTTLHALVIFDHEGCGREDLSGEELEDDLERRLSSARWDRRARAVVIGPELENWVWSDSPHVADAVGWDGTTDDLRRWLMEKGFESNPDLGKPTRPKEAVRATLARIRKKPSAALLAELAGEVSFQRCEDRAFVKLRDTLRGWFPPEDA